jgi:hypothetical protein
MLERQFKELQTTRGFQSSSEPIIHFGYGKLQLIPGCNMARQNVSNN